MLMEVFRDRLDAASLLAERLKALRGERPLVLAIPRGAVPIAAHVARQLGGDLDLVLVRKIGAPFEREFAIGAVAEDGSIWLHDDVDRFRLPLPDVLEEARRRIGELRRSRERWTPRRGPLPIEGRVVVLVDDGVATGNTFLAAVESVRRHLPRRIVAAVPVAPPQSLARISAEVDEVVCLQARPAFRSIGEWYVEFPSVRDDEVTALLEGFG